MQIVVITDSCSDLPYEYVQKYNVPFTSLVFRFQGFDYPDDFGQTISYSDFYKAVREGETPTTSQVNVETYIDMFQKCTSEGKSIIYLCFSSGLSGSYNSAVIAKNIIMEEKPDADITIIDTRSASLGQGLLVYYAVTMLEEGASKDEIVNWVEKNPLKLHHWFTVDDLGHLKRGGRLSGTAAFVGTILNIKPVLHVDDEGHLIPKMKAKGRKRSLRMLVDKMEENAINPQEQVVAISHGDALEDANYVAQLVRSRFNVKDIIINHVGPVIGSHSGPGTIALFFLGGNR